MTPSFTRLESPTRRMTRVILGVGAVALLATGCGPATQSGHGGPRTVPVTVGNVVRRTMPVTLRAIGNVEPIETVDVKARIGGALRRIAFTEGDRVAAGDVLFEIDPRPSQAALDQAEAVLARDQALLAKAEADTRRYADLVEKDYVTREQYDQILANAGSLNATVDADRAAVDTARLNLEYCTITAPVSGRTGALNFRVGTLVKANDDRPLVTLNRTQPIHVAFAVPAQLLAAIQRRTRSEISVVATPPGGGGAPVTGRLSFIDNTVDTSTSTVLLKATFDNRDDRLWPGMFVDVTVTLGEEPDRVVCPAAAVQTGQQGTYVFVVDDDKKVELRAVKVNRADDENAVIDEGLEGGETVVTDGQLRLVPGATVEIKNAGTDAVAAP